MQATTAYSLLALVALSGTTCDVYAASQAGYSTLHVNVILDVTGSWQGDDFTTVKTALTSLASGLGWAASNRTTFTLLGAETIPKSRIDIAPRAGCTSNSTCKTAIEKVTKTANVGEVKLSWPTLSMRTQIAPTLPAVGCGSTSTRFQSLVYVVAGAIPGPDSFEFVPTSDGIKFLISGYDMRPAFFVVGDPTANKANVENANLLLGGSGKAVATTAANLGTEFATYLTNFKTLSSCAAV